MVGFFDILDIKVAHAIAANFASITNPSAEEGDYSICSQITSKTAAMIARRILEGTLNITGLKYPTISEIYQPILHEYAEEGISSNETILPA